LAGPTEPHRPTEPIPNPGRGGATEPRRNPKSGNGPGPSRPNCLRTGRPNGATARTDLPAPLRNRRSPDRLLGVRTVETRQPASLRARGERFFASTDRRHLRERAQTRPTKPASNRRTIRACAIARRSCPSSATVPQRDQFVSDPVFAEHNGGTDVSQFLSIEDARAKIEAWRVDYRRAGPESQRNSG
jgi:hypothetical protein